MWMWVTYAMAGGCASRGEAEESRERGAARGGAAAAKQGHKHKHRPQAKPPKQADKLQIIAASCATTCGYQGNQLSCYACAPPPRA
jgi:hypothetical protein